MTFRNKFSLLSVMFVFIFSAVVTIPAYADDGTPSGDVPVEVQPTEPPTQESAVEEAALQTPPEPAAATSPVASILAEIPQDTQVVVMDEAGNQLPLATQEAANVIVNGDPMWCPVGVTPGGAGCTSATSSFETMISNLTGMYGSAGPSKAGVIWIEDGYNNTVNDSAAPNSIFTLNGSVGNLTAMKDFALTIQGGWSGTGKVITPNGTSTFSGVQLNILNWNGDVTLNNIVISGAPGANGLQVFTTKNIVLTNVQSFNNSGRGALLQNDSGTGNVTITNSQFIANMGGEGVRVESKGIISLKDVTANANTDASNGYGAFLYNQGASTPKAIVLSGTNTFNGNQLDGLYISSAGVITLNNIIASNNGSSGAQVSNNFNAAVPNGVTLTGINTFTDNAGNGLDISTYGPVKASNLYANSNDSVGVQIDNHLSNTSQLVTLTGTNEFKYNIAAGLGIFSKGQITLNNITANSNGTIGGAYLDNTSGTSASGITFTGANSFNLNEGSGLKILTNGTVLLNAITANGNGISGTGSGADINNGTAVSFKNVTITGVNSFSNNHDDGLKIVSSGIITLNNITASFNSMGSGDGANLDNTLSGMSLSGATIPKAIILAGTNEFNANMGYGLEINTYGAVTTNNITANDNISGYGAYIRNDSATLPQTVTLNGVNKFNDNAGSGLYVISKGAIRTNALTANGNGGNGALLDNSGAGAVGGVTMTGVNAFSGNTQANLTISSRGAVVLNSITSDSSDADGATIFNTASSSAPVTITGTNSFTLNKNNGLIVSSNGLITVSNLTASNNGVTGGSYGAQLNNSGSPAKAGVNLTGVNSFIGNTDGNIGLQIYSLGNVKVSSVTAKSNGGIGVEINNSFANGIGSVTLIGTNIFSANAGDNLRITSAGIVSLTNINSTGATGGNNGAAIDNTILGPASPKAVTLSGVNVFSGNTGVGLSVLSNGLITASNIAAESNGQQGAYFSNSSATLPAGVTLTGTNKFNLNGGAQGLYIETKGLISIASIIASGNTAGEGASLNNNYSGATAGVTLSGFNAFNSNSTNGLTVLTNGAITISNLTATHSQNGYGVKLDNLGSPLNTATPKGVTLSGTNNISNNDGTGLIIDTYGAVLISSLTANDNGTLGNPGYGADIDNYQSGATIAANVTLTGTNAFEGNYLQGLLVDAFGSIVINNLTANSNSNKGAELNNTNAPSNAYGVTLTGLNQFNKNLTVGLYITTQGAVILNSITAKQNFNDGVYVDNTFAGAALPKPVTLIGTQDISGNSGDGLYITSNGAVTASNVTASSNIGGYGVYVNNSGATSPALVNITGVNTTNSNGADGMYIDSKGKITLNSVTANTNSFDGLHIINDMVGAVGGVTLTGTNFFNTNTSYGSEIFTNGAVNLTKITGDDNNLSGLYIETTSSVTITCGSFNVNTQYGWQILSASNATIKGVFTAGNGLGDFTNSIPLSTITVRACPLP